MAASAAFTSHASNSIFSAQESRRAAVETQGQNSGQIATISCTYTTTGEGYTTGNVSFGTTFVQEPALATGAAILPGSKRAGIPTCGVLSWDRTSAGYYTGATIWARVDGGNETGSVLHTLTFSGHAIKTFSQLDGDLDGAIAPKVPKTGS